MKCTATITDFWTGNSSSSRVESLDSVHVQLEVCNSEVTENDTNDGKSLSRSPPISHKIKYYI